MKKMKLLALCLCMGLVISACGANDAASDNSEATNLETEVSVEDTNPADSEVADNNTENTEDSNEADDSIEEATEDEATDSEATEENDEATDENEETLGQALTDVYAAITDEVELVSPMEPSPDFIMNFFGINISEYEEYVFEMSEDAVSAETIIMIRTNGSDQTDSAKAALEGFVDNKKMELENYLPEEYDIVADSEVVIKDDYVYLVISHNADAITAIIENNL